MTDPSAEPPGRPSPAQIRDHWDSQAADFDDEPDHGLRDPATRAAWADLLGAQLPATPCDLVDLGCGTGTLAVLLAQAGHRVRALDLAPQMIAAARVKATAARLEAQLEVEFAVGDAATPPYAAGSVDAVIVRHVLWALPDPAAALDRWSDLLRPGGVLVLVEGHWHTGAGLRATDCAALVAGAFVDLVTRALPDPVLWGGAITDERYLLTAHRR